MHDELKKAMGIDIANCQSCAYLGTEGDGPEYNGNWAVCDKIERMGNLKSFPFKKEMKCWHPEFWYSKFQRIVKTGTDEEMKRAGDEFCKALNADYT